MNRNQAIGLIVAALMLVGALEWLYSQDPGPTVRRTLVQRCEVTIGDPWLLPGQDVDEAPIIISDRRFVIEV